MVSRLMDGFFILTWFLLIPAGALDVQAKEPHDGIPWEFLAPDSSGKGFRLLIIKVTPILYLIGYEGGLVELRRDESRLSQSNYPYIKKRLPTERGKLWAYFESLEYPEVRVGVLRPSLGDYERFRADLASDSDVVELINPDGLFESSLLQPEKAKLLPPGRLDFPEAKRDARRARWLALGVNSVNAVAWTWLAGVPGFASAIGVVGGHLAVRHLGDLLENGGAGLPRKYRYAIPTAAAIFYGGTCATILTGISAVIGGG